jgi:uncharacterized membrane-anchored protein
MIPMGRLRRTAAPTDNAGKISGPMRIEHHTRAPSKRLREGNIAVIDVMDLDQHSAEELVRRRPSAVVNAQPSISGRYPTGGALLLVQAGIALVDHVGPDILSWGDGTDIDIEGGTVSGADGRTVTGTVLTETDIVAAMSDAATGMDVQLASFTANAMDHVSRDADVLLDGKGLPDIGVDLTGKQVVIVAVGYGYEEQLTSIRRYLRERKPVIIAVGSGADQVLAHANGAAVIVGNVEGVSERALKKASHVVLHDPSGAEPGTSRMDALGLSYSVFESGLASEDIAMLVAHAKGADVIVTVGLHTRLLDFLEQGRSEVAGTFLTRLQVGESVIDASALARIYRHRYSWWSLVALVAAALVALGVAVWVTPGGRAWIEGLATTVGSWWGGA